MDEVEVAIIGAGAVGLAIAAELSKKYNLVVLERHGGFGQETSSRNSEVIHSGIYYLPGSLKARLSVEGLRLLYDLCRKHSIPHKKTGKLIVATDDSEVKGLEGLVENGLKNGVSGLRIIGGKEIASLEPAVTALAAIHSPETGIIDAHSLMKHLFCSAEAGGAVFSFTSEADFISPEKGGYVIGIKGEDYRFFSKWVVNSAGLSSDTIASLPGIDVEAAGYGLSYFKGSYFSYQRKSPVGMLIYPLPEKDLSGLGVHATVDISGRLRFGPDSEPVKTIDYGVDPSKRDAFFERASKFIKGLRKEAFIPDMAGVRPRPKGTRDFIIRHEAERGLEGFINLIGIESPGLTACLSIGAYVRGLMEEAGA